jgi:hypothetical protein
MKRAILVLVVLWSMSAGAQSLIVGEIYDSAGKRIAYATVMFQKDTSHSATLFCIADKEGKFRLTLPANISDGLLQISSVGFATKTIIIHEPASGLHLGVTLTKQEHQLPPMYVKADNAIQISGDTISYRAERFKRGNEQNLANLLANMPGFRVDESGLVSFNGLPIDNILVQGEDLTGNNYELLVRKLGVDGIDKLQVIRNYKDPANILSKLSSSSKQVLNINFKDNYLNRFFGSGIAAGGFPSGAYEAGDDLLGLTNKLKLLNVQTINNTGDAIAGADVSGIFRQKGSDNKDPFDELDLAARPPVASIPEIDNILQLPRNFASNSTVRSAVDLSIRPGSRLTIKGRFNEDWDRHSGQSNTTEQYFLPGQTVEIRENRSVAKKSRFLNNALFLNWMIKPKEQLALLLKAEERRVDDNGNSLLEDNRYLQTDQYRDRRYGAKLVYNRLLGSQGRSAISFDLQYNYQHLPGDFGLRPPNYDSFFFKSATISDIGQHELQKQWELIPHAIYIDKTPSHKYSVELTGRAGSNGLITGINANNNSLHLETDSANRLDLGHRQIGLKVQDEWSTATWMTFTFNVDAQYQRFSFGGNSSFSIPSYQRFVVLPGIFVQFTLSHRDRLNLSASLENRIPDIAQIASGYSILQLTAISKGSDTFLTKTFPTAQLLFSHIAVAEQGLLLFAGANLSRIPFLNVPDQFANAYYSYSNYQLTERTGINVSLFTRAEWFVPQLHLRFAPELSLNTGKNFSILSGTDFYTQYAQWKTGLSTEVNLEKLQVRAESGYYLSHQHRDIGTPVAATSQWRNKLDLSWKIKQGLFFDAHGLYDLIYPPGRPGQDILLLDGAFMYHFPRERWIVGLQANNLLNKLNFSQSLITPSTSIYSNYSLLHRVVLAYVRFSF